MRSKDWYLEVIFAFQCCKQSRNKRARVFRKASIETESGLGGHRTLAILVNTRGR